MAVGYVSAPGQSYGPCRRKCKHLDCKASRETAECVCRICGNTVGYDTGYLDEWHDAPKDENGVAPKGRYGYFVHAVCLMQEAEAKRSASIGTVNRV